MTLTKTLLVASLAALAAGCGGEGPDLDALRADERPYYWVGESFEGLELTHAETYRGRFATFVYGTCQPAVRLPYTEGGCAPPLQVQNVLCSDGRVNVALFGDGGGRTARAARRLTPLNGAARNAGGPVVSFDRSLDC